MALKAEIEKLFEDNTNYANARQAINQASSLNALSRDLYTDSKRFVYELLQNADDSAQEGKFVEVWMKIIENYLVVAHSGNYFDVRDVQGICNINNGTKKSDLTKTGYKGIGFKSVFGQSDKVIIFTKGEYFRFDSSYKFQWKWEGTRETWETDNDGKFQFPWQIIPIYTNVKEVLPEINTFINSNSINVATIIDMNNKKETVQAIKELSENLNMFLFLKNIFKIKFDIENPVEIKIDRTIDMKVSLQNGFEKNIDWLINTINLEVPTDINLLIQDDKNIPEKLRKAKNIDLTLACKLDNDVITKLSDQEKLLYSYLPTGERKYSLPVLVNTSFMTTANRESLHVDSKWNQWIFKQTAIEIFRLISELVTAEFGFEAYNLIPNKTLDDALGKEFNDGIIYAKENISFVLSQDNQLIKIKDAIIDFTYLSKQSFIDKESIKMFLDKYNYEEKKYVKNCSFFSDLKKAGALVFEWKNLNSFLSSPYFIKSHTHTCNIELIKHFKKLCEQNQYSTVSKEELLKLPFIFDHKNNINYPNKVCLPTPDDENWDSPDSELLFVHKELQNWLLKDLKSKIWLESLGVKEKTDITYVIKLIKPNVDNYINEQNAINTIITLFSLYRKGSLSEDLIKELTGIKLMTKKNTLCSSKDCYFSDYYNPILKLENTLDKDIFLSETYCGNQSEKDYFKIFFKMLGVQEEILASQNTKKCIYQN